MDLSAIYKTAELDELTRRQLDQLKLLPSGNFKCECHLLETEFSSLDRHHAIPQEVGGLDTAENVKYLCVGCHQLLHRLALKLMSTKAHKSTPLDDATAYAKRVNSANVSAVVANLLMFANLVVQYKVLKADKALAPPEGVIVAGEMPNKYKALYKQISWEIKRGDGRGIGMANLTTLLIMRTVAEHRPELKREINSWISNNLIYVSKEAAAVWRADDRTQEQVL